jgi:predicted PurR-regulated permease PerM
LWQIRIVVFLFLTAVVVATALNRLVRRFRQSNVQRGYAILLSLTVILSFLGILIALITIQFVDQFNQILNLIPISLGQLRWWSHELQSRIPDGMMTDLPTLTNLTQQLQAAVNWMVRNIYLFFSNSLVLLLNALFIFVLTIMLVANPQAYRRILVRFFPAFYRQRANEILSECELKLVHCVTAITLSIVFVSITSTIGLFILQIPFPMISGVLAGLSAFIPYIGVLVSAILPILLALLDEPWKAVAVLLLYLSIQQIEGNFVIPLVMKRRVDLLPATTLALLAVFGILFGFWGLLLGLPVLVVAKTWLEEVVIHDILDRWKHL